MVTALAEMLLRMPRMGGLARRLLRDRDVVIRHGVGKGLRFNVGASNTDYALGRNELSVQEALARLLKPAGVFYDVGANVGFFTVIAARLLGPRGRVLAFEPVPENARLVGRNAELNGFASVEVHEVAIARRSGEAELRLADYAGGAALGEAPPPPDLKGSIRVRTLSLDDLLEAGSPPPDVVKIDVEGAEMAVFEGMARCVRRHRPAILYEVDAADAAMLAERAAPCAAWLQAQGYRIEKLANCYPNSGWCVSNLLASPAERAESRSRKMRARMKRPSG
jgi:FkbM family methyltransferase